MSFQDERLPPDRFVFPNPSGPGFDINAGRSSDTRYDPEAEAALVRQITEDARVIGVIHEFVISHPTKISWTTRFWLRLRSIARRVNPF